ncbi:MULTISPECIES: PRC-barrel domain-containing protein [Streptacidiphilus]|uniref:PRC-barrel domain-containing protein n=1 Tax=Streptacidiphilus cavernicola TaxID=3342716 RepID=A0ABV6UY00_9ACTN|nr:PRC-barrel domain-containing protein [Streptacidiphilus jeojiense]
MDASYAIGEPVSCSDGECGRLDRVLLDPVALRLTHLVVDPGHDVSRLVPVDLVDESREPGGAGVLLRCDTQAFRMLEPAEETEFVPADEDTLGFGADQVILWPYYGLGAGTAGIGAPGLLPVLGAGVTAPTTHERVPSGEVQIRRGQRAEATDGEVGHVQGLVVDPEDQCATHVLLQEGHLLGRKTVAVPITLVTSVGDTVRVHVSKKELADLPPVDVDSGHP